MSSNSLAISRLKKDYYKLKRDPIPYIIAEPLPSNMLEWHYVIHGPEDSPYAGGIYHGKLKFPQDFPFRPPSIMMITPSGRFKTNFRLCLSMSDYHPDTWNPSWTVSTLLTGLLSFMLEPTATLGSIDSTDEEKRLFARQSHDFNVKDPIFAELFPDTLEEMNTILASRVHDPPVRLENEPESSSSSRRSRGFLMGTRFGRYIEFLRKKTR